MRLYIGVLILLLLLLLLLLFHPKFEMHETRPLKGSRYVKIQISRKINPPCSYNRAAVIIGVLILLLFHSKFEMHENRPLKGGRYAKLQISIKINPPCSYKRAALIYRGTNVLVLVLIPLKILEKAPFSSVNAVKFTVQYNTLLFQ